eukprot:4231899-Prymnesium_polylepis.2
MRRRHGVVAVGQARLYKRVELHYRVGRPSFGHRRRRVFLKPPETVQWTVLRSMGHLPKGRFCVPA